MSLCIQIHCKQIKIFLFPVHILPLVICACTLYVNENIIQTQSYRLTFLGKKFFKFSPLYLYSHEGIAVKYVNIDDPQGNLCS